MKKIAIAGLLVGAFLACAGLTVYKGADSWVFRSTKDDMRSAVEIWPTTRRLPTQHALAEVVWYRKAWNAGSYERLNISAMTDSEPMYRFGVERGQGSTDKHRPIWFCFERPESEIGLPAYCPLRLNPLGLDQGVWLCDDAQRCSRIGG